MILRNAWRNADDFEDSWVPKTQVAYGGKHAQRCVSVPDDDAVETLRFSRNIACSA